MSNIPGALIGKIAKIAKTIKIKDIIMLVKTAFDVFKKPAKEVAQIDQTDSIENIEHILDVFTSTKEKTHIQTIEIEKSVYTEVSYYIEELLQILDDKTEVLEKYGVYTKSMERRLNRIPDSIKGSIDNELSKRISLDNYECKEIIKMIPGTKKEEAISRFFSKSMREALDVCCKDIHICLDDIYIDVEEEIIGKVDSIQILTEQLLQVKVLIHGMQVLMI